MGFDDRCRNWWDALNPAERALVLAVADGSPERITRTLAEAGISVVVARDGDDTQRNLIATGLRRFLADRREEAAIARSAVAPAASRAAAKELAESRAVEATHAMHQIEAWYFRLSDEERADVRATRGPMSQRIRNSLIYAGIKVISPPPLPGQSPHYLLPTLVRMYVDSCEFDRADIDA